MSPLTLRRFRAERLLKREFEGLRSRVIETARRRLLGTGVDLDICDLEACYALAWQGLYGAVLEGQEIDNPAGWLVLVTFRRAIEEHRARGRAHRGGDRPPSKVGQAWREGGEGGAYSAPAPELDLAAELDDRLRLRHLFEGLSARMSTREREAAVLCYLQGLPRAQAAARLGVSERRMRKLMEGQGPGRPGVAGKMGALIETIRAGDWCEEQGSLMRGLAFGVLDPEGERYRLALLHRSECPACRHYVASLRGLAAVLPPLLLRGGLSASALTHLGEGAHFGAPRAGGWLTHAPGSGTGAQLGGTLSASGAAGAGGAAGGGWLLAGGSLGAKLAAGCLLALGVGAGCVALEGGLTPAPPAPIHRHRARAATSHLLATSSGDSLPALGAAPQSTASVSAHARAGQPSASQLNSTAKASQEFGPEQPPAANTAQTSAASGRHAAVAHAASASPDGSEFVGAPTAPTTSTPASTSQAKATREFSPG
jgi:DNA-directed RNA polymerase specialized sigma24 family protein